MRISGTYSSDFLPDFLTGGGRNYLLFNRLYFKRMAFRYCGMPFFGFCMSLKREALRSPGGLKPCCKPPHDLATFLRDIQSAKRANSKDNKQNQQL